MIILYLGSADKYTLPFHVSRCHIQIRFHLQKAEMQGVKLKQMSLLLAVLETDMLMVIERDVD